MRCYFNYFTSKNLKFHYGYFVVVLCILHAVCAQRPPYSLQAAVDELHRREAAKYPLNAPPAQHFFNGLGASSDMDYWDEDSSDFYANTNNNNRNRHKLNKALAKYLERENYEADPGSLSLGPFGDHEFDEDTNGLIRDEKKRSSFFRERDNEYDNVPASVFRERESPLSSGSELTEQFLHEIEETKERERQEHLKDKLRELWEKYQQQDNELPNEAFEEKSKRMRVPPYYMLMQKRSYPVLPWLPYKERKKRFPVAKRSANRSPNDNLSFFKTDDKVAKELSELFGEENVEEDMKKRSLKETDTTPATIAQSKISDATTKSDTEIHAAKDEKNENDSEQMAVDTHGNEMQPTEKHAGYHAHTQKEHKHRKRSDHHSQENDSREEDSDEHDEEEEEEEDEPEHEHDGDHDDEHEDAEGEDDEDEQKKKRDTQNMKAVNDDVSKNAQTIFKDLSKARAKKSVQWSKYFGIDRKKKAQSGDIQNRPSYDEKEYLDDLVKKRTKWDPDTLDNMDRKLQSIEDFIIDEAVKYTGAHEGITSPTEIRRLKDHVLSRLATAYSLEKMRRALDNLRLSQDKDKHLLQNVIESEENNQIKNNQKRLSVKKETVSLSKGEPQLPNPAEDVKEVNSNAMMSSTSLGGQSKNKSIIKNTNSDDDSEVDAKKKKQKKRNSYLRYPELPNNLNEFNEEIGPVHYEALNDAYLGNKNYIIGSNQCPLIETMADRCRGVDLLSGDLNQELLPACGVHQICYLCGTSQVACDYQYLAEADEICGLNNECQAAARSVLMILRGTPGRQLGPRACLKNPCLYSAMREIGL